MLKKICTVFLFFHILLAAQASSNFEGHEISDEVQKSLITAGFSPLKTNLISPSAGDFPYNLSLDFYPEDYSHTGMLDDYKTNAVIIFSQNDFLQHSQQILEFLAAASNLKTDIPFSVLFVHNGSELLNKGDSISGSEIYVENLLSIDNTFAVSVRFTDSEISKIMPGNGTDVSPLWLVKQLSKAFQDYGESYTVPAGTFLTVYRYGLIENDRNEESFLSQAIPAVSLALSKNCNFSKVLSNFLSSYDYKQSENWDRHYFFWKLPWNNYVLILKESILIKLYLAAAILTLLTLCGFPFVADEKMLIHSREIKNSFYILPLIILITFVSLSIGKSISNPLSFLFHLSPVMQFYLKVQISFIFISFILIVFLSLAKTRTPYAYKFYIILSTIINIFVFCIFDLSYFFLFAFEYLLVSPLRNAKKLSVYILTGILLFVPFVPYGIILWQSIKTEQIPFLLSGSNIQNLFSSAAILPFNVIWLFILAQIIKSKETDIEQKNTEKSQTLYLQKSTKAVFDSLKKSVPIVFIASLTIYLCFFVTAGILGRYRNLPSVADIKETVILKETDRNRIEVNTFDRSAFGNTIREIQINSAKNAERYEIKISGTSIQPVYEATVPYIERGNATAVIKLPDFPPEKCNLTYTTTSKEHETLTVTAYFSTEEKNVFEIETKNIVIAQGESL